MATREPGSISLPILRRRFYVAARSSLSTPGITILSASSESRRYSAFFIPWRSQPALCAGMCERLYALSPSAIAYRKAPVTEAGAASSWEIAASG